MSEITTHFELANPFFPLEDSSGVWPELAGTVTLRSVLSGKHLSIYTIAPITRFDASNNRIGDIRIHEIDYHFEATDWADMDNPHERRAIAEELRFLLSLAGHDGDWRSGAENIEKVLEHYGSDDIDNTTEFNRLICDARKHLEAR